MDETTTAAVLAERERCLEFARWVRGHNSHGEAICAATHIISLIESGRTLKELGESDSLEAAVDSITRLCAMFGISDQDATVLCQIARP